MWVTKTSQILLGEENTAGGGASAEWPLRTDSLAQSIRKTRIRGTEGRTRQELGGVGGSPSGGELEGGVETAGRHEEGGHTLPYTMVMPVLPYDRTRMIGPHSPQQLNYRCGHDRY